MIGVQQYLYVYDRSTRVQEYMLWYSMVMYTVTTVAARVLVAWSSK